MEPFYIQFLFDKYFFHSLPEFEAFFFLGHPEFESDASSFMLGKLLHFIRQKKVLRAPGQRRLVFCRTFPLTGNIAFVFRKELTEK